MSVEDFEREMTDLARRFWEEEIDLSQELKELRKKYPKSVRKEYLDKHPPNPHMRKVFASMLCDPDFPDPVFRGSLLPLKGENEK